MLVFGSSSHHHRNLSNEFYSLIPTQSGRQRPPKLDNMDIVTEKEGAYPFGFVVCAGSFWKAYNYVSNRGC
jgi:hypothetical protein